MWLSGICKPLPAEKAILTKTLFLSVEGMWQIKHMFQKHTGSTLKPNQSINDVQPSIFFFLMLAMYSP